MTYEQILEELKKLKLHTDNSVGEHEVDVNIEVAEIDDAIESYTEKISALEAKIADVSNYQYNNENEERDLTIELLEESFENQLEVMDREDAEYKSLQDLATSIFTDYNLEIATLNVEIEVIERRLRKNEIAVRKNIGIRLTDEELLNLNLELDQKRARVQECENMKAQYVEDLRNYGELITANNRKREIVLAKQDSLNKVKAHRDSKVGTIDNAKLRIDKDELASLKAGVAALNARKDYITYNPTTEIDKLIQAIEQNKEETKEETDLNVGFVAPVLDSDALAPEIEGETIESPISEETHVEDKYDTLVEENEIENPTNSEPLGIPEETSAHDMFLAGNPDLDEEREAEIEEAQEVLKEKKKTPWFRQKWARWVLAGVATIAIILSIKACGDDPKDIDPNDFPDDDISQSQTDDGITDENEQDLNDKYEMDDVPGFDSEPEPENQPEVEPEINPETQPEVEPEINPETQPEVEPETQPEVGPEIQPDTEPEIETGEVELEQGESAISVNDILNGNVNEDTVIEHGDEVGKTTENLELKDYTEDGNAVVEFDKVEEPVVDPIGEPTEEKTTPSREDIIKNLEEFMGGEITFTDEGNQWIDQMSGRSR